MTRPQSRATEPQAMKQAGARGRASALEMHRCQRSKAKEHPLTCQGRIKRQEALPLCGISRSGRHHSLRLGILCSLSRVIRLRHPSVTREARGEAACQEGRAAIPAGCDGGWRQTGRP